MAGPLDLIEQGGRIGRAYGGGLLGGVQNAVQMWGHMQDRERQQKMDSIAEENRLREIRRQDESDARQRQQWGQQDQKFQQETDAHNRVLLADRFKFERDAFAQAVMSGKMTFEEAKARGAQIHEAENAYRQSIGTSSVAGPRFQLDEATQGMQDAFGGQQAFDAKGGLLAGPAVTGPATHRGGVSSGLLAPGGASYADIQQQPGLLGGVVNNERNQSALLGAAGYVAPVSKPLQVGANERLLATNPDGSIKRDAQGNPIVLIDAVEKQQPKPRPQFERGVDGNLYKVNDDGSLTMVNTGSKPPEKGMDPLEARSKIGAIVNQYIEREKSLATVPNPEDPTRNYVPPAKLRQIMAEARSLQSTLEAEHLDPTRPQPSGQSGAGVRFNPGVNPKLLTPAAQNLLANMPVPGIVTSGKSASGHNAGSTHGLGDTFDYVLDGDPKTWGGGIAALQSIPGVKVLDERVRPKGQRVWTGPHIHIRVTGQQAPKPAAQPQRQTQPPNQTQTRAPVKPNPAMGSFIDSL